MRIGIFKIEVLLALLIGFTSALISDNYIPTLTKSKFILSGSKMIDPRSIAKIDEIGNELLEKTGIGVYIYAKESYSNRRFNSMKDKIAFIKVYEANITKNLQTPFILLTLSLEDTHVNLLISGDIKGIVDKDTILDRYTIPLLASKDKNSMYAKVSAAMFNGYTAIADKVAEVRGVKLESGIGSDGTVASTIWRVTIYTILIIGLILYTIAVLKSKKD